MRIVMHVLLVASLLVSGLAAAAPTPAEIEDAKKRAAHSRELYDEGDMPGALNEMKRAYTLSQNYKYLYNVGQIQAQQLDYASAIKSFKQFLKDGGTEVAEARRTEVLRELDRLSDRTAELTIQVNQPGAEVTVDDTVVGTSPLSAPVLVNAGKRKIAVSLNGYFPLVKSVDVVGQENAVVKAELSPVAAASPPVSTVNTPAVTPVATPASGGLPLWLPWAATGALAVGTVVSGVLALGAQSKQKELIGTFGITAAQQLEAQNATRTGALVTDILGGLTIAAAVGSTIYTVTRPAPAANEVAVTGLSIGPTSVSVSGAF